MTAQLHDAVQQDSHAQLRALYVRLIENQEYFDEFKQLLAAYPNDIEGDQEPSDAASVRQVLNERIQVWTGGPFDGLSATQVMLWRSIIVEERINVQLSPWKESNLY